VTFVCAGGGRVSDGSRRTRATSGDRYRYQVPQPVLLTGKSPTATLAGPFVAHHAVHPVLAHVPRTLTWPVATSEHKALRRTRKRLPAHTKEGLVSGNVPRSREAADGGLADRDGGTFDAVGGVVGVSGLRNEWIRHDDPSVWLTLPSGSGLPVVLYADVRVM